MVHALIVLAAGEAEPSKTAFFICAGLAAAWAVVVSVIGLRRAEFPDTIGGARGVMAISIVLVAATMAAAVITA
jgi:hypothetical protein